MATRLGKGFKVSDGKVVSFRYLLGDTSAVLRRKHNKKALAVSPAKALTVSHRPAMQRKPRGD